MRTTDQETDDGMEQNKVLMVIVSVAIFFAAIIGVGVALLYPRGGDLAEAGSGQVVREFDPIEYVRNPDQTQRSEEDEPDEPLVIVYGDSEPEDEPPAGDTAEPASPPDDELVGERPAGEPAEPAETAQPVPADQTPEARTAEPAEPEAAEPVARRQPPPEPRQIRVTEYWIQLIASPNRDRVEQARVTLSDYSLGGRVTTRDVDGELFSRLRVGPYATNEEAEQFLEWIRDIDGFGSAYISEEYPLRSSTS